jgi:transposase
MSTKKKRTYTEEFRRDAVSLIRKEGYTLKEASERLGIHESILGKWRRRIEPVLIKLFTVIN